MLYGRAHVNQEHLTHALPYAVSLSSCMDNLCVSQRFSTHHGLKSESASVALSMSGNEMQRAVRTHIFVTAHEDPLMSPFSDTHEPSSSDL